MVGHRALSALLLAVALAFWPLRGASPREATPAAPEPAGKTALDLAAMTLDGNDLPTGYGFVFEGYIPPSQLAGPQISLDDVAATGLRRFYQSTYANADQTAQIRSYVEEYPDPDGARAGFALLEDETRTAPDSSLQDQPGPGVGEEPAETTVGTYKPATGKPQQTVDATFREGRLLVGVAMETTGSTKPDSPLVKRLAGTLDARVRAVVAGKAPTAIDLTLPPTLLPLAPLQPGALEGHLTAHEALGAIDPKSKPFTAFTGSYIETIALGDLTSRDPAPYVEVKIASFSSAEAALAALNQADKLPAIALGERVPGIRVQHADATVAYRFAFQRGRAVDSFRVVFVVGDRLATVEVWESPAARSATLDLAGQQAACLDRTGPCTELKLPAPLRPVSRATPVATPKP